MTHHLYHVGDVYYYGLYPWYQSWLFVELFFIFTGYLTYRHFSERKEENVFKASALYTLKKFLPFVPYVCAAVVVQYVLDWYPLRYNGPEDALNNFLTMPVDAAMLGDVAASPQRVVPLWFLTAMLIVFPLVAALVQLKNKYALLIISGISFLVYYGWAGVTDNFEFPLNLARAFAGMMIGVFAAVLKDVVVEAKVKEVTGKTRAAVAISGNACLCLAVALLYTERDNSGWLVLILFALGAGLLLSGFSATSGFYRPVLSFLGKLSLPMFIWQWPVATAIFTVVQANIAHGGPGWSLWLQTVVYYLGTIAVSVISYVIVEAIKKKPGKAGA